MKKNIIKAVVFTLENKIIDKDLKPFQLSYFNSNISLNPYIYKTKKKTTKTV